MGIGVVAFDGVGGVLGGFTVEDDAVAGDFICGEELVLVSLGIEADDVSVFVEFDECFLLDGGGEEAVEGEECHDEDDDKHQAGLLVCHESPNQNHNFVYHNLITPSTMKSQKFRNIQEIQKTVVC